jgi:hypothetical protein
MALTLFAVNNGYFDDIDVKKALAAERSMRDYVEDKYADLAGRMEEKKDLSAEDEKALKGAIEDWKKNSEFASASPAGPAAAAKPAVAERAPAAAGSAKAEKAAA